MWGDASPPSRTCGRTSNCGASMDAEDSSSRCTLMRPLEKALDDRSNRGEIIDILLKAGAPRPRSNLELQRAVHAEKLKRSRFVTKPSGSSSPKDAQEKEGAGGALVGAWSGVTQLTPEKTAHPPDPRRAPSAVRAESNMEAVPATAAKQSLRFGVDCSMCGMQNLTMRQDGDGHLVCIRCAKTSRA